MSVRFMRSLRLKSRGLDKPTAQPPPSAKSINKPIAEQNNASTALHASASTCCESYAPCRSLEEFSGPFVDIAEGQEDQSEVDVPQLPSLSRSTPTPLENQQQQQQQQRNVPSGGALQRLERRMSMESVSSLHARRQQQEQRLLNHDVGAQPTDSSLSKVQIVGAHSSCTSAVEPPSRPQEISLKGLVEEFEQSFS